MKYKLLKDLCDYKAGTIFRYVETPAGDKSYGPDGWHYYVSNDTLDFTSSAFRDLMAVLLNTPGWFEPIDETPRRWRARQGEEYWIATALGRVDSTAECGNYIDDDRHGIGNYFRTMEQAQAAADAIKAVLAYIQQPDSSKADDVQHKILDATSRARYMVCEDQQNDIEEIPF